MSKFIRSAGVLAIAAMLMVLIMPSAHAALLTDPLTLGNTPTVGGTTTVSGNCGPTGGGTVNLTFTQNGVTTNLGTTTAATGTGLFNLPVTLPNTITPGTGVITANCTATGNTQNSATLSFPGTLSPGLTLGNTPSLGNVLPISASCGTTTGGTVNLTATQNGVTTNLGSATLNPNGTFSTNATLPSTLTSGPVTLTATCPTGSTISSLANVLNPANLNLNTITPNIGGSVILNGICPGAANGSTVTLSALNNGVRTNLGTTTITNADGTFVTPITLPTTLTTGPATIQATCPAGGIITAAATLNPMVAGLSTTPTTTVTTTTTTNRTPRVLAAATTPSGAVGAGFGAGATAENSALATALILLALGALGFVASRKLT